MITFAADLTVSVGAPVGRPYGIGPYGTGPYSRLGLSSVIGNLAVTQAPQTLAATARVTVGGSLSATQAPQTLAAAGTVRVDAALGVTQANQTLAATGTVVNNANLHLTQAPQTLSATGVVVSGITASLALTQAPQTLSAQAFIPVACINHGFGRGLFGKGLYGGFPGNCNLLVVRASASLTFTPKASLQSLMALHAASSIVFDARAIGPHLTINPEAVTEIRFDAEARATLSWAPWAPCEPGGWQQPAPCEQGVWQASGDCSEGVWTETRLV